MADKQIEVVKARAEANFKKKEQQAREGDEARAEYEAASRERDKKTARLRTLRLAKEAAGRETMPTTHK